MDKRRQDIEYFLGVLDEAEAALTGDVLLERKGRTDYCVLEKDCSDGGPASTGGQCRKCPLWKNRTGNGFYFNPGSADILFILAKPENPLAPLDDDAMGMYERQMSALGIERSRRALLTILKCPSETFIPGYADSCKDYLKAEISSYNPRVLVLLGTDCARYMLRKKDDFDSLRASSRSFSINGIRTFATYSQRECISNRMLRKPVWDDLQVIGSALK